MTRVIHYLSEIDGAAAKPLVDQAKSVGIFTMSVAVEFAAPILSQTVSQVSVITTPANVDYHIQQLVSLAVITYCLSTYSEFQVFIEQIEEHRTFTAKLSPEEYRDLLLHYVEKVQDLLRLKLQWGLPYKPDQKN